jgi:hypothetical protein
VQRDAPSQNETSTHSTQQKQIKNGDVPHTGEMTKRHCLLSKCTKP